MRFSPPFLWPLVSSSRSANNVACVGFRLYGVCIYSLGSVKSRGIATAIKRSASICEIGKSEKCRLLISDAIAWNDRQITLHYCRSSISRRRLLMLHRSSLGNVSMVRFILWTVCVYICICVTVCVAKRLSRKCADTLGTVPVPRAVAIFTAKI